MSTSDADAFHRCAACGKGGEGHKLKKCTACLEVRYCGVECQGRHRSKHKKQCRKRADELLDDKLFASYKPPEREECPICFISLPPRGQTLYEERCGKILCAGCAFPPSVGTIERIGNAERRCDKPPCPFCRSPPSYTEEEMIERHHKRADANDAEAIHQLGLFHILGSNGLQIDEAKGLNFLLRAAKLGLKEAHCKLGRMYAGGIHGVESDVKKAIKHFQIAAIGGDDMARHYLGLIYLCHISRIYLFGISDFSNSFVGDCVHFRTPRVDTRVGKAWGDGPSLRLANGEESA